LKIAYTQIAQRNMMMSAELLKIMQLLEKNQIESLAFKGPSLAQMAYGDITPLPQKITQQITKFKVLDELSDFVLQSWQTPKSAFQQTAAMLKLFPGLKKSCST
jgi:hypothetical protein